MLFCRAQILDCECHLWWTVNRKAVLFMSTESTKEQPYDTELQLKDFPALLL